jgi:hypothetical protein
MHDSLDFQDAIRKIEERGDFNRFAEVKPIFVERLDQLKPGDYTERGLCYYYLLVSYLKAHLVHETEESIEFYDKMDHAFQRQEEVYKNDQHKFSWGEIKDFYRLMNRCYGSLEFLYLKHDFQLRREKAFSQKMNFRKSGYFFRREYWHWFEYKFIEVASGYGTSIPKWAITTLAFTFLMALIYFAIDQFIDPSLRTIAEGANLFDYFYFSAISLTAVGFGDIAPLHWLAKAFIIAEAFTGYLMLGIFIGMVHKKL